MATNKYLTFGIFACAQILLGSYAFAQTDLSQFVWATHNTGAPQQFLIDHYTNAKLAGVVGEDIDVAPQVPHQRKVTVAILDTGIDYNHPQLKNVIIGKGMNFVNPAQDATDTFGHGTHIAGIIAAQLDARGFQGVSPNAMILPVKVVQTGTNAPILPQEIPAGRGTALTETVAKGLTWAVQNGAEVVNISLSWPVSTHSKTMDAAMALAAQKNVIIVASAANDSTTANLYPCIYENVICVGSQDPDGSVTHFSNFGPMVDLMAPGMAIFSTFPMTMSPSTFQGGVGYEFKNGTSFSAPFVAGVIAELLSRGYSPAEAKARVFLGARPKKIQSLAQTDVLGQYSIDHPSETKTSRFGNLDMKGALALTPQPLILPQKKGFYEVDWDGVTQTATIPMTWINRWADATGPVTITVQGQSFSFPSLAANATVVTNVQLNFGVSPEDIIHLTASVDTDGFHKAGLDLTAQVIRTFNANSIPSNAIVKKIVGLDPTQYSDIRTVQNVDNNPRADLLFMRYVTNATELAVVQDNQFLASAQFQGFTPDQFLNSYRLGDGTYAAVFTKLDMNIRRPSVYIEKMDKNFKFIKEIELGTDVTVLSEGFTWAPFKGGFTPLWVSIGFTPKLDMPAYDPWNPTFQDTKIPRLYYLDGADLHMIKLADDEGPLQVLIDGRVLISKGGGYLQTYKAVNLKDGQIVSEDDITLPEYRMLIGLDAGIPTLELNGNAPNLLAIAGSSTTGNQRVTGLGTNSSFDDTLMRSTYLDAIVTVSGVYHDPAHQYYFAATDYNFQFFTSGSNQTLSTTLNRYSLIPSMIAASSYYPVVVKDQNGNGLPAIYLPANAVTGPMSEVVIADPKNNRLMRPASLHLQVTDGSCFEMGDLMQASPTDTAKQVFICNQNLVQIPLQIQN